MRLHYLYKTGSPFLRFNQPRTFNEKIWHRKLYERDPRMPLLIDKVEVKKFVAERLGTEWIVPTLYAGSTLPPRDDRSWPLPYVIKPSHRAGGAILFIRSGHDIDWPHIEATCAEWTSDTYGRPEREWGYSQVPPRVLVEPCIGGDSSPPDYKFYVFNSRVHYAEIGVDRECGLKLAFFDRSWNRQRLVAKGYPEIEGDIPPPASLESMIAAAEKLGAGWPFVRIDMYEDAGTPKFGEFTFYPAGGTERWDPPEWERVFGDLWPLRTIAPGDTNAARSHLQRGQDARQSY
jgi:hypothetical protein